MVHSPSWEANWFAASQEIPRISRNPKVHYCTHKRPPPVSILGQPNPVHITTSYLPEIHPNIIHPFTPRSPQWSPSLLFPHQDPIHTPLLTHTRHMPSPSHSFRFYHLFISLCMLRDVSPGNTPPLLRDPSGGVVYLRFVLSPEQASHMWVFLNRIFLQGRVISTAPNPQAEGPPLVGLPRLLIQYIRS